MWANYYWSLSYFGGNYWPPIDYVCIWNGVTNNWDTTTNWKPGVPTQINTIVFDSTSVQDCDLGSDVDVINIDIQPNYTGKLSLVTFDCICKHHPVLIQPLDAAYLRIGDWKIERPEGMKFVNFVFEVGSIKKYNPALESTLSPP